MLKIEVKEKYLSCFRRTKPIRRRKLRTYFRIVSDCIEILNCETNNLCKNDDHSENNELEMIHLKTEVNDDKILKQESNWTSERNVNETTIEDEASCHQNKEGNIDCS